MLVQLRLLLQRNIVYNHILGPVQRRDHCASLGTGADLLRTALERAGVSRRRSERVLQRGLAVAGAEARSVCKRRHERLHVLLREQHRLQQRRLRRKGGGGPVVGKKRAPLVHLPHSVQPHPVHECVQGHAGDPRALCHLNLLAFVLHGPHNLPELVFRPRPQRALLVRRQHTAEEREEERHR